MGVLVFLSTLHIAGSIESLLGLNHLRLSDWSKLRFSLDTASFWWAIPLMIVLAIFGYWSYRQQSASPRKRLALGIIRAVVLVILLGLFLRPTLVLDQESKVPSVVAVWLDDSRSMEICDPYSAQEPGLLKLVKHVNGQVKLAPGQPRANRFQLALDGLCATHPAPPTVPPAATPAAPTSWLRQLAQKQHVAIYSGGQHAQLIGLARTPAEVETVLAQMAQHKPVSDATDVPTVVQEILRDLQGQPVSAVVLLTDGRTTEGTLGSVGTAAAQQFHTPIYAVPLGQANEPLNVRIAEMTVPESTFVKDPVAVKLKLHVSGITLPTPVRIHLFHKLAGGGEA
ncbi:MAG: hypothetical protein WCI73_03845, partial [Phycisphaerae bacterium]